jgi:hypothetical protein
MDTASILSTFAATSFALLNPMGMLPVFMVVQDDENPAVMRGFPLPCPLPEGEERRHAITHKSAPL